MAFVLLDGAQVPVDTFKHPGGNRILNTLRGHDVTQLYRSYHLFSRAKDEPVYNALKATVHSYFTTHRIDYRDWRPGAAAFLWILTFMLLCWRAAFLSVVGALGAVGAGVGSALLAMHTMHDLSHFAMSHSHAVWEWGGHLVTGILLGGSVHAWRWQHVIGHHVHTNDPAMDPDVPQDAHHDPRRIFAFQRPRWIYRYQQWYLPVLYALLALKIKIQDVTVVLRTRTQGSGITITNVTAADEILLLAGKILHVGWRVGLPVWMGWGTVGHALGIFLLQDLAMGLYLACVFQVSHLSRACQVELSEKPGEWAIEQVRHCVDYATQCPVTTFLTGALNHQTAHHLFPAVSQYHLPTVTKLIRQELGPEYNCVGSFREAWNGHVAHLRHMAGPDRSSCRTR